MNREMKTVLVTGGSGFLGINLIRHLRMKGVERIRVLDIAPFDYPEAKEPWLEFTLGDVRDPAAVNKCVEGCDAVVNTAAALPLYSPEDIRTTEVDGARNVIAACRRAGDVRMVQISSTAVYGVRSRRRRSAAPRAKRASACRSSARRASSARSASACSPCSTTGPTRATASR